MDSDIVGYAIAAVIAATTAWKAATTPLLKDASDAAVPPYSFARSQFLWWTVIIALCISVHYGLTGEFPQLNHTVLILLGLGAGTAGTAGIIDQRQDATSAVSGKPRSQDSPSQGWLTDVLSDNSGVSVHRFQALVFNLTYGVMFVSKFLSDSAHGLPEFDESTLGLLGLSASAYVFMKSGENQGPMPGQTTVPAGGGA